MDVLTALRAATSERHTELDSRMPLAAPAPDLRAYRDHLQLLAAWLAPLQRWQREFESGLPRRDYLAQVCADLQHEALAGLPAAAPLTAETPWPRPADAAYHWGVAYVVEGSQLGGTVLYKKLAERLAPHPLNYLRGEGPPGPRWQQFMAALRAAVVTPQQIEQACQGARQAFDTLLALLNSSSAVTAGRS